MKAKFKVSQMAAKPIDVELVHTAPEYNVSETGGTGIFVKVVGPHSKVFHDAKEAFDASPQKDEDSIRLFASCVVGWEEEDFEMPWSPENSYAFFSNPENSWAANYLIPIVRDHLNFYSKK